MAKRETPLFSLSRAKILAVLKKNQRGLSIEGLARESKMSRASVYNHLKTLKAKGLINEEEHKELLGQPIFITTNKANPISLSLLKMFEKIFPDEFN